MALQVEVLQNGLRNQAISIIKAGATMDFLEAIISLLKKMKQQFKHPTL